MSFRKSSQNKTLTGSLGGLADYWHLDYMWLRVIFVILAILTRGWALLLYPLLVAFMPPALATINRRSAWVRLKRTTARLFSYLAADIKSVLSNRRHRLIFAVLFLGMALISFNHPLRLFSGACLLLSAILFTNFFNHRPILDKNRPYRASPGDWRDSLIDVDTPWIQPQYFDKRPN